LHSKCYNVSLDCSQALLCIFFNIVLSFSIVVLLAQSVAMPLDIFSKFTWNNFVLLSCYINLLLLLPNCYFLQHFIMHLVCNIDIKTPPLFHFLSEHFILSFYFGIFYFYFVVFCSKHHVAPKIRYTCTIFAIVNPSTWSYDLWSFEFKMCIQLQFW